MTVKSKLTVTLCALVLPMLGGCVSDNDRYDLRSDYPRGYYGTSEERDRAREAWQRDKARRDAVEQRDETAYREAADHRRFCRNSPSSMFCRYD